MASKSASQRTPKTGASSSNGSVVPPTMVQSSKDKPPHPSYDYTSVGVKDNSITTLKSSDFSIIAVITVIAFFVRLFRIAQPSSVVFDEVHFGGFASKYIKGKFFMDVHPPLAKLLITLAGHLAGFDGEFDFKDIGKDYLEPKVPYVAMRLLPAILGVLAIPCMYLTLKASGCKSTTAALGGLLLTFENGFVTQSRLILLDSPLVIFTALTGLSWISFTNLHEQGPRKAFTTGWWFWLASTGLSLGATASVKWVGLFTIAWVGSLTALQLWVLLGDSKNVTPRIWFKHLFARIFCLIIIPVSFYMAMFAIHFLCLVNPGDGDGFMSSEFQATLNSKGMADVPADIILGSRVTLRHHNTQGGYLHSHPHMYPTGSKQQQITLYPHKDSNNAFLIENQTQPIDWAADPTGNTTVAGPLAWDKIDPAYVTNGAMIRLYHIMSDRRVHSHDVRAPITEVDWQNEVSAYGYEGFEGDANDLFRVEIVKSMSDGQAAKERLRTIQTKFRLVHVMTGCTLFSHRVKLPDWGFEQQEVTCARGGTLPNSIWYIEGNEHPQLGAGVEKVNYRNPGFFGKFWELQQVMWTTNNALIESHAWDSRPPSWPILRRGINFWGQHHKQIYLTGNPLIWWSSTAAIAVYVLFKGLAVLRWQRSFKDYNNTTFRRFDYEIGTTVLAWAFHYFPFYLMERQLFLHHYFPALYFAIMVLCQIFDYNFSRVKIGRFTLADKPIAGQTAAVLFLGLSIFVFTLFAPLTYGNSWTKSECSRVKLFSTWDWECNNFHDNYNQYALDIINAQNNASVTAPVALQGPAPPIADDPRKDVHVTAGEMAPGEIAGVAGVEEKVEYRDEKGNLLDAAQIAALAEGQVSFSTRYETRTRLVDAQGREIGGDAPQDPVAVVGEGAEPFAGTSASAPNPETVGAAAGEKHTPAKNDAAADLQKGKVAAQQAVKEGAAQPEGEDAAAATKDEL